ncbi:hypothetical protein GW17_00047329 [Ensete ventricosum]|nr:hypothetical protein GW17_00047329 [Ensete ventricosum]
MIGPEPVGLFISDLCVYRSISMHGDYLSHLLSDLQAHRHISMRRDCVACGLAGRLHAGHLSASTSRCLVSCGLAVVAGRRASSWSWQSMCKLPNRSASCPFAAFTAGLPL